MPQNIEDVYMTRRWQLEPCAFRLRLGSLLILVACCAICCSYLAMRLRKANRQEAAIATLLRAHWVPLYDYEVNENGEYGEEPRDWRRWFSWIPKDALCDVREIRWLGTGEFSQADREAIQALGDLPYVTRLEFGDADLPDDFDMAWISHLRDLRFLRIEGVFPIGDKDIHWIGSLPRLESLILLETNATDLGVASLNRLSSLRRLSISPGPFSARAIAEIAKLPNLEHLVIGGSGIADDAAPHFARMRELHELHLFGTRITDDCLRQLATLPRLEVLDLNGAPGVTDRGMDYVRQMRSLRQLDIHGTLVSETRIQKLREERPELKIRHEREAGGEF